MVPTFKQLPDFAQSIAESIQGNTTLLPEEIEVIFYTDKVTLQKINEDFFYSMNPGGKEKPKEVSEIAVRSHGIIFTYKEKKEE